MHYGLDFHARLPLALLVSAQSVEGKLGFFSVPGYDSAKQRISLAFSNCGQVLLRLERPLAFCLGLRSACLADQLLISLDDREAFLAALDLARPIQSEQSATTVQEKHTLPDNGSRAFFQVTRHELPRIAADAPVALRAEGLTRHYAGFTAVEDLNLSFFAIHS